MANELSQAPSTRREHTRERLLDAAIEVFAEEGVQGASVESICQRADFTRGAFYSNFTSKEQLFLTVLEREFARRGADFKERAEELEPHLHARKTPFTVDEAAQIIVEFFLPSEFAQSWFILETEFLLMALRDPALAPSHQRLMTSFLDDIEQTVASVLEAAGRTPTMPLRRVLTILMHEFATAMQASALAGPGADDPFETLGDQAAELVFALSSPITKD